MTKHVLPRRDGNPANAPDSRPYGVPAADILRIVCRTLDCVDPRLVNHGSRVAALARGALERQGRFSASQIQDIGIAALLHDVGAYKTEEIDRMVGFETVNVWEHAIYGYLYLKYFSPLPHLAPAVLFHHADNDRFAPMTGPAFELGQIFYIADRIDIIGHAGRNRREDLIDRYFVKNRGTKFRADILDLYAVCDFPEREEKPDLRFLEGRFLSRREMDAYIRMVVLSVDFRSAQTVTHTIAAAAAAKSLAGLTGMTAEETDLVVLGAMLHDLGKQGIPAEILEAPHKLSPKAMEVMKTHVSITERILDGSVDETLLRIAVRHHEKLDGSGYPRGLTAPDLSACERLVAVADIFSALSGTRSYKRAFSRERIVAVLREMADGGLIDADIVRVATENFETVIGTMGDESRDILEIYRSVGSEYRLLNRAFQECDDARCASACFRNIMGVDMEAFLTG